VDTLLAKLKGEEARKQALVEELSQLDQAGPSELDLARTKRELNTRLADLPALLSTNVSEGRKILRLLFEEPLQCTTVGAGEKRQLILSGTGNFMNLLPIHTPPHSVVSPSGMYRVSYVELSGIVTAA
jgi:hypothetical protein